MSVTVAKIKTGGAQSRSGGWVLSKPSGKRKGGTSLCTRGVQALVVPLWSPTPGYSPVGGEFEAPQPMAALARPKVARHQNTILTSGAQHVPLTGHIKITTIISHPDRQKLIFGLRPSMVACTLALVGRAWELER